MLEGHRQFEVLRQAVRAKEWKVIAKIDQGRLTV
jgi:hypothetical protein